MNRPAFFRPAPAPRPASVDYPDSDGQAVALRAAEARVAELEARMRAVPRTPSPKRADNPDGL